MVTEPPLPEHRERTVYAEFGSSSSHTLESEGASSDEADSVKEMPVWAPEVSIPSEGPSGYCPVPLFDNVHVLAPLHAGETPEELAAEAERMARSDLASLDPFDLPERDRMYQLATTFAANHVRQVRSGSVIWAKERDFPDGTVVVSEKAIPRLPFRLVRLNWAIEGDKVIDVRGHHVFAFRLRRFKLPKRRFLWAPGKGDSFDLPYLLGNVCAMLSMRVPEPVAAVGVVALETNQVLGHGLMEHHRQAAAEGGMRHLIYPFATHLMPGLHQSVRYWPAHDVNEGAFSLFAASCADLAIPDLKRRWRVKMAVSWISLLAILAACGAFQLSGFFLGHPPLVRWAVGVAAGLFILSSWATHKYYRIDR